MLSDAGHDVYLYNFAHHFTGYRNPDSAACQLATEIDCGVFHASELRFVWDNFQIPFDPHDRQMAHTMGTLWTDFAKHGSPNGRAGARLPVGRLAWPRYNASADLHLELQHPGLEVRRGLSERTCDLIDSLPQQGPYPH